MKKILPLLTVFALTSCGYTPPELHFVKCDELSSPSQPVYSLFLTHAKPWTQYSLVTTDSMGRTFHWGSVWIDDFGNPLQYKDGVWVPLTVACPDYAPAEYLNVWLLDFRGKGGFYAHIVPHPHHVSQYGYNIYLEKDDKLAHQWRLVGNGFEPGDQVDIITYSGPNIFSETMIASSQGEIIGGVDAWVEGKREGDTRMCIYGPKGELTITFPWGNNWHAFKEKFIDDKRKYDSEYRRELAYEAALEKKEEEDFYNAIYGDCGYSPVNFEEVTCPIFDNVTLPIYEVDDIINEEYALDPDYPGDSPIDDDDGVVLYENGIIPYFQNPPYPSFDTRDLPVYEVDTQPLFDNETLPIYEDDVMYEGEQSHGRVYEEDIYYPDENGEYPLLDSRGD